MTLSEATIDELVQHARGGDEAARATLIGGMRERVFRWALVLTGDTDDADDVTQQVLLAVHRKLDSFQGQARFTTWLYTIVRNTAFGMLSSAVRRRESSLPDAEMRQRLSDEVDDQISRLDNQRAAALVRSFFVELPARQRELLELIDSDGYSIVEAARIMGIEPETARGHLLRARRKIRTKMLERHPEICT